LVVVEANEVPRRVIEVLAPSGRIPFLAGLLADGCIVETVITEELRRELYPSQTWASMNTGVPYADHGVYWYGDPKPEAHPFYWQVAARDGRTVGMVNTLHSSPLAERCVDGRYRFVIPDAFSDDAAAIPVGLERFQRASLALTGANSRKVSLSSGPTAVFELATSLARFGLRRDTAAEVVRLVSGVAAGRVPRERLRAGQFLIHQDLFLRLAGRCDPDLAVLFTNHVAAAMHRYWYASFPDDFEERHYDDEWVARHRDEIPAAMAMLDRFLGRMYRWCVATGRTLVVASSMGQGPSAALRSDVRREAVISDPALFLNATGVVGAGVDLAAGTGSGIAVKGSMAPQLTLDCGSVDQAEVVAGRLAAADVGPVFWDPEPVGDLAGEGRGVVTLTANLEVVDPSTVRISGLRRKAEAVGVTVYEVDDHSSGRHIPEGILAVANSPTFDPPDDKSVDQLDVAPAILSHLGLEPLPTHRQPTFQL
jgi:hypothetical protein